MNDKTKIEWTDATWNPIRGCSRVSEGCRNCYAETMANRFSAEGQPYEGLIAKGGQWNGIIKVVDHAMDQPLRWRKPRRIFVNSMSDLFHENVPVQQIARVYAVMCLAHRHTFQVLTKRPERMRAVLTAPSFYRRVLKHANAFRRDIPSLNGAPISDPGKIPPRNVLLGVSIEDQATADERIPLLLQTPAAIRFVSAEPLLGPVDLRNVGSATATSARLAINALTGEIWRPDENGSLGRSLSRDREKLDWVIVGGESGRNARPMHPDWVRSLRDQCGDAIVPFFFKQWGAFAPNWYTDDLGRKIEGSEWMERRCKKLAGRELDDCAHSGFPEVQP